MKIRPGDTVINEETLSDLKVVNEKEAKVGNFLLLTNNRICVITEVCRNLVYVKLINR